MTTGNESLPKERRAIWVEQAQLKPPGHQQAHIELGVDSISVDRKSQQQEAKRAKLQTHKGHAKTAAVSGRH